MMSKFLWILFTIVTAALLLYLSVTIYKINVHFVPAAGQLTNTKAVNNYLARHWAEDDTKIAKNSIYIPTGIYIESLKFVSADTLRMSGYVWQYYKNDFPKNIRKGVVFPDAENMKIVKSYKRVENNQEVIGWYFEGTILQALDYSKYPFDHKFIKLRIWPQEFAENLVLTPDLRSYQSTGTTTTFGIDEDIFIAGYTIKNSFFKYSIHQYDTDFGIPSYTQNKKFPELIYVVALQRNAITTFMVYILPMIVVIGLGFAMTLIITHKKDDLHLGFNLSNVLRICTMLLFVVLFAHIKLREYIPSDNVIYLEYIYFIFYMAIIYIVIDAFIVARTSPDNNKLKFFHYNNNFIPSLIFLPLILLFVLIFTLMVF